MTILVTGATGFTGINIVRTLAEAGQQVVACDLTPADATCHQFIHAVADRIEFVVADVIDLDAMLRLADQYGVRRIVHAAGITPSGDVESSIPLRVADVNLMSTVRMLEVARHVSAERFVFVSSSGVYGAPEIRAEPVYEDSIQTFTSLYAICKHASELLLQRYSSLFGLSTVSGRMGPIYGPMERRTDSRGNMSMVYKLVDACRSGRTVAVRGLEFVADYTHVYDASEIWRDLTLANNLSWGVYNVSGGVAYALGEVLETLRELEPGFSYRLAQPDRQADIELRPEGERGAMDVSRVRTDFGFSPRFDLKFGLSQYLTWSSEHPEMFQR